MTEEMKTVHYVFHIATPQTSQIVKTTIVASATVLALRVGVRAMMPRIRKINEAVRTENAKWSPPAE